MTYIHTYKHTHSHDSLNLWDLVTVRNGEHKGIGVHIGMAGKVHPPRAL